jgi:hypothetical protein
MLAVVIFENVLHGWNILLGETADNNTERHKKAPKPVPPEETSPTFCHTRELMDRMEMRAWSSLLSLGGGFQLRPTSGAVRVVKTTIFFRPACWSSKKLFNSTFKLLY